MSPSGPSNAAAGQVTWSLDFRAKAQDPGDDPDGVASFLQAQPRSGVEGLRRLHEGGTSRTIY